MTELNKVYVRDLYKVYMTPNDHWPPINRGQNPIYYCFFNSVSQQNAWKAYFFVAMYKTLYIDFLKKKLIPRTVLNSLVTEIIKPPHHVTV